MAIKRYKYEWSGSVFLTAGKRQMTHFCDPTDVDKLEAQLNRMRCCENCSAGPTSCRKTYGSEPEETRCHPKPGFPFYLAQWSMKE